jgi:Holliday junction resolvase RusA-like endonuclease
MQSENFEVFIEVLPPGINRTYASTVNPTTGKSRIYKSGDARDWARQAALVIGSQAALMDFEPDGEYNLYVEVHNSRMDIDAPLKLIQDTVTEKLGFDDRHIQEVEIKKIKSDKKGVLIKLEKGKNNAQL